MPLKRGTLVRGFPAAVLKAGVAPIFSWPLTRSVRSSVHPATSAEMELGLFCLPQMPALVGEDQVQRRPDAVADPLGKG